MFADTDWVQVVNAVGAVVSGVAGIVAAALVAYYGYKIKMKQMEMEAGQKAAAVEAAVVKSDLTAHNNAVQGDLADIKATANSTHEIVNSQRTEMVDKIDGLKAEVNDLKQAAKDGGKA